MACSSERPLYGGRLTRQWFIATGRLTAMGWIGIHRASPCNPYAACLASQHAWNGKQGKAAGTVLGRLRQSANNVQRRPIKCAAHAEHAGDAHADGASGNAEQDDGRIKGERHVQQVSAQGIGQRARA